MTYQYFPPPPPPPVAPRRGPTRRRVLALGAAGAGGVAAVTTGVAMWAGSDQGGVDADNIAERLRADHMQVIAHPDDDLFFNNPDIANSIAFGSSQMTVCLLCGEAEGFNGSKARKSGAPPDFTGYTAARYQGLRSAYGYMAAGDPNAPWTRQPLRLPTGHVAELATLDGNDSVKLLFLNMWVEAKHVDDVEKGRLYHLWQGLSDYQPTMVIPGSPVQDVHRYTREDVITAIHELLRLVRPKIIRTMDLDPDQQTHDDDNLQYADQTGFSDSYDHTPTALFTWEAYLRWRARAGGPNTVVTSYRGYYNRRWPSNLSEPAVAAKAPPIDIYAWNDHRVCGAEFGCGDLNVSGIGTTGGYGLSTVLRYPERTDWAFAGDGGRLTAITMIGSRATLWSEQEAGSGTFLDPVPLHNEFLLPEATIAPAGEGTCSIQGIRPKFTASGANHIREIVRADIPGRAAMAFWEPLGNPALEDANPVERRSVGQPVYLHGTRGTRWLFARNFGRSFSFREFADGSWAQWETVDGPRIQDGLAALKDAHGGLHVFAAGTRGIVHWRRSGSSWSHTEIDGVTPAAGPTAVRLVDDRIAVFTRESETAEVIAYVLSSDGTYVEGGARNLGAGTGTGSVAVLPWKNATAGATLAVRTDSGQVIFCEWSPDEGARAWTEPSGPMCVGLPSLVFNAHNVATAFVVGHDAALYTARQSDTGQGPITGWTPVGTS